MGLPQPLADALRDFGQVEAPEAVDPARRALSRSREDVRVIETNLDRLKECGRTVLQTMERRVSAGDRPEDLDEYIDALQETEEEFRREFMPHVERDRRARAAAFSRPDLSPADKALAVNLLDRRTRALLGGLQTLRDLRWSLMALRAGTEEPGDAPVFNDPQDLLGYLKTALK
jgi:predicted RNase H-like nuclease (RuvC/YqgF family)